MITLNLRPAVDDPQPSYMTFLSKLVMGFLIFDFWHLLKALFRIVWDRRSSPSFLLICSSWLVEKMVIRNAHLLINQRFNVNFWCLWVCGEVPRKPKTNHSHHPRKCFFFWQEASPVTTRFTTCSGSFRHPNLSLPSLATHCYEQLTNPIET